MASVLACGERKPLLSRRERRNCLCLPVGEAQGKVARNMRRTHQRKVLDGNRKPLGAGRTLRLTPEPRRSPQKEGGNKTYAISLADDVFSRDLPFE